MLVVNKIISQGHGLSRVLLARAATVSLDWDMRQKSRFAAVDSEGRELAVFLARGTVVRGGDVLVTEDGSLVRVLAQAQPVLVVRRCAEHGGALDLLRAAYQLGNRHVALELHADRLQLAPDHVLAEMLERMHLRVTEEHAAFEPEGGAYAHANAQGAQPTQAHEHPHDPGHAHGNGEQGHRRDGH